MKSVATREAEHVARGATIGLQAARLAVWKVQWRHVVENPNHRMRPEVRVMDVYWRVLNDGTGDIIDRRQEDRTHPQSVCVFAQRLAQVERVGGSDDDEIVSACFELSLCP